MDPEKYTKLYPFTERGIQLRETHLKPANIADLAALAREVKWDPKTPFREILQKAQMHDDLGKAAAAEGDIELAFVQYAKAATLIFDEVPTRPDYLIGTNEQQKKALRDNGQDILYRLADLKPRVLERYDAWLRRYPGKEIAPWDMEGYFARRADLLRRRRITRHPELTDSVTRHIDLQPSSSQLVASTSIRAQDTATMSAKGSQKDAQGFRGVAPEIQQSQTVNHSAEVLSAARKAAGIAQPTQISSSYDKIREATTAMQAASLHNRSPTRNPANTRGISDSSTPRGPPSGAHSDSSINRSINRAPNKKFPSHLELNPNMDVHLQMPMESPSGPPLKSSRTSAYGPITTTTPPLQHLKPIAYPEIMTPHQRLQGYSPSRKSRFNSTPTNSQASTSLYNKQSLPRASAYQSQRHSNVDYFTGATLDISAYDSSHPKAQDKAHHSAATSAKLNSQQLDRSSQRRRNSYSSDTTDELSDVSTSILGLRIIHLPRESLGAFLNIASYNTARNVETCGLFLGKPKGDSLFVVTVLLIPKQKGTSDTCNMEEEELVSQITEQRNLITLGWIHTHPSQSCFMSSLDLHTHAGFQCMLPESFAIVCAPKFNPPFGIFRLTDPPGLQTILDCTVKAAFHPHHSEALYTDADRGHILMKDQPIEIIDLRT